MHYSMYYSCDGRGPWPTIEKVQSASKEANKVHVPKVKSVGTGSSREGRLSTTTAFKRATTFNSSCPHT